jgi:hypothetical protein
VVLGGQPQPFRPVPGRVDGVPLFLRARRGRAIRASSSTTSTRMAPSVCTFDEKTVKARARE